MTPPASQGLGCWGLTSTCGTTKTDVAGARVSSLASWTTRGKDHPTARLLDLVRSSPVEWCNRFVSFGLGYALSWSGVSSCWVGWGVSRDLVRMSRLR